MFRFPPCDAPGNTSVHGIYSESVRSLKRRPEGLQDLKQLLLLDIWKQMMIPTMKQMTLAIAQMDDNTQHHMQTL